MMLSCAEYITIMHSVRRTYHLLLLKGLLSMKFMGSGVG